jgi:hypothetical protein
VENPKQAVAWTEPQRALLMTQAARQSEALCMDFFMGFFEVGARPCARRLPVPQPIGDRVERVL